jgi:hypothetical protein
MYGKQKEIDRKIALVSWRRKSNKNAILNDLKLNI